MSHVSVKVRLRPIRFGFLVNPNDKRGLLDIFRINTCLWGGKFNPIIPYLKQIPKWWDREGRKYETASQIMNGYLDFFEPDFLVEAEKGLGDTFHYEKDRILQLSDILSVRGDRDMKGHGLNVMDIYRDLYRKEYQFARRHENDICDVKPSAASFGAFSACLFGAFPKEESLSYFEEGFIEAFAPKSIALDSQGLSNFYKMDAVSPLDVGASGLDVEYHDHSSPTLFVLDVEKSSDLIDFWNLRASRKAVLPIPIQWAHELSTFSKTFILKNFRPLPGNSNGVKIRPTVMFARSIPANGIEITYSKYFQVDVADANVRQDWYPPLWRPSPRFTFREMRPSISAGTKTSDIPIEKEKVLLSCDCLRPEFAAKYGNHYRWANVSELRDWTGNNQIATVFPTNYRDSKTLRLGSFAEDLRATTEGLISIPRFETPRLFLELSDGATAIKKWLKAQGIAADYSDAGRSTGQIVQTLGGFQGVAGLAHPKIVNLLNHMSRSSISRSSQYKKFYNQIKVAVNDEYLSKRSFNILVQRNAVELGLELRCQKCSSWSWHALKELGYRVTCGLCLRPFDFPITEPSSSSHAKWSYRLVGPFALPNYANGGYAAALSLRFFADVVGIHNHADLTWSPGQTLNLGRENDVEADYILWFQRKSLFGNHYPADVVFGEAKSFGKDAFKLIDVERMKSLALRFPGAILVFSTMKEASELSKDEHSMLSKLALWGREYVAGSRQSRAPLILLTGTELFAPTYLEETWKQKGGRHAEIVSGGFQQLENLRILADLTQQLYLNLPSHSAWLNAKWRRRTTGKKIFADKSPLAINGSMPS